MRINNLSKIAVAGAAASLCFATAAPALAHDTGSTTEPNKTTTAPTLAQQQAWIDGYVAKAQQKLSDWAAKVAVDPKLTTAQKADWAQKIADKQAALTALKTAADAATTTDELHAAIKSSMQTDGVHGFGGWCGFWGGHHWNKDKDPASASKSRSKGPSHATTAAKKTSSKSGPASSQRQAGHTVTLRAQRRTVQAVQGQNAQGKHWGGQAKSGGSDYQGRHGFGGSGQAGSSHAQGGASQHNGGSHHR